MFLGWFSWRGAVVAVSVVSDRYSGLRVCFLTFLVSYLKLERGFTLTAAQVRSLAR
jgi:hypothetical protein